MAQEGRLPMQAERNAVPQPLLPSRAGVLAVEGWGLRIQVHRGRLLVSDGLGPRHREGQFFRARCGIKRLVLVGRAGSITLEALRWLNDVGASLVHIDSDGTLLAA